MADSEEPPRKPAREHYDAFVSVHPHDNSATHTYAVVKFTYAIRGEKLEPAAAVPLVLTRLADEASLFDLGIDKTHTDVVIAGHAYPSNGSSTCRTTQVSIAIGAHEKTAQVFGTRLAEPHGNEVRFTNAEPFARLPLRRSLAYGGVDPRVATDRVRVSQLRPGRLASMTPGEYPRNPDGKAYVVAPFPEHPIELPNLEDPSHRLTEETLVVAEAEHWYRQPLPWHFSRMPENVFQRYARQGGQPWFMPPEDAELEEVRRGYLSATWFEMTPDQKAPASLPSCHQEGSLGLTFRLRTEEAPVRVNGMYHAPLKFTLPNPPQLYLQIEAVREEVAPVLTGILLRPDDQLVHLTYVGRTARVPRAFRPEFHSFLPIAVTVNGDRPIMYEERAPRSAAIVEPEPPTQDLAPIRESRGEERTRIYQPPDRAAAEAPFSELTDEAPTSLFQASSKSEPTPLPAVTRRERPLRRAEEAKTNRQPPLPDTPAPNLVDPPAAENQEFPDVATTLHRVKLEERTSEPPTKPDDETIEQD